jgi:hypothetical protein
MTTVLVAAGALMLVMATAHTAIGVLWVLPRLPVEHLPRSPFGGGSMTSSFITVSWHAVGIMLLTFGVVLLVLGRGTLSADGAIAVRGVAAAFTALTLMVLWLGRRSVRTLVRAPMWVLFVAEALLCWVAASA